MRRVKAELLLLPHRLSGCPLALLSLSLYLSEPQLHRLGTCYNAPFRVGEGKEKRVKGQKEKERSVNLGLDQSVAGRWWRLLLGLLYLDFKCQADDQGIFLIAKTPLRSSRHFHPFSFLTPRLATISSPFLCWSNDLYKPITSSIDPQ